MRKYKSLVWHPELPTKLLIFLNKDGWFSLLQILRLDISALSRFAGQILVVEFRGTRRRRWT
jgi:hypothetical protein